MANVQRFEKVVTRAWRRSDAHYAGTEGSGAADHSNAGRPDNRERSL